MEWVEKHKSMLKPPVGNKLMLGKDAQFQVMIVGGPNTRTDFHIDEGEEWFYQIKGDMLLKIVDGDVFKDIVIPEGYVFLLPGKVPHSPQRFPDTIGLVIERQRDEGELDGLRWYCSRCHNVNFQDFFQCSDLGTQLKGRIDHYYSSEEARTCKVCGTVDTKPEAKYNWKDALFSEEIKCSTDSGKGVVVDWDTYRMPFELNRWVEGNHEMMFGSGAEFRVRLYDEDMHEEEWLTSEKWFYQLGGETLLKIIEDGIPRDLHLKSGDTFLLPKQVPYTLKVPKGSYGISVECKPSQ